MGERSRPAEFVVNNPENLVRFYENVFGWPALQFNHQSGWWEIYDRDAQTAAPIVKRKNSGVPSLLYNFRSDNLEEMTKRVIKFGGRPYIEGDESGPMEIPGFGLQAFFCDPEDNMFGIYQLSRSDR